MNYTRHLWNDVLACRREPRASVPLLLISCFLALLPVTFYIASHINSSDVRNNLLQRELPVDCECIVQRSSPQGHGLGLGDP